MARKFILLMLLFNLSIACTTVSDEDDTPDPRQIEQSDPGIFKENPLPLNVDKSGSISVLTIIRIESDELFIFAVQPFWAHHRKNDRFPSPNKSSYNIGSISLNFEKKDCKYDASR